MTIYDISKKAGVSIATVSRVLNGSDKVRPSTKKKVRFLGSFSRKGSLLSGTGAAGKRL